jgi:long-chain acyl-CoA synthetase
MEKKWHKVWPVWVPKTYEVDRPTCEYIREWAELTPDGVALNFFGRRMSYRELNDLIDRFAAGLLDLGLLRGDRVAVHMENCPQFVIAYFGAQRAGGVVVPVNPMFKGAELEQEMNDAGIETYIGMDSLYGEVAAIRHKTSLRRAVLTSLADFLPPQPELPLPDESSCQKQSFADTIAFGDVVKDGEVGPVCNIGDLRKDLALLQYTGGTTGIPKGAMISHYAHASSTIGISYWYHLREDDVHLGVTPFFHVMGQVALMCSPLASGGSVVILPRFVPPLVAEAITRYHCTGWVAATTMIIALVNLPTIKEYDLSSLRYLWTGGSPVSVELQNALKVLMPKTFIGEGYGLSETITQGGASTPLHRYRPGFVGIPQMNVDMKIVDIETESRELGPNQEGEIVIRSATLMSGYWGKPEATKEMLRDGWLYTGDTGLMDEDGYVKFLGRTREMIKCSGFSVFPAEVEGLFYQHPAVKECAVIGVPDPYRGESPKAFVILKKECLGTVTEAEMLEWCKENMAAYKRPRSIVFREELPKSSAGKLLKRVLVEEERAAT